MLFLLPFGAVPDVRAQNATWQRLPQGPTTNGRHDDIEFIDEMTGWVVNGRGEVHRTEDGGQTWEQIAEGLKSLRAIAMANRTTGWVGMLGNGSSGVLWETRDGGERWSNISYRIRGNPPDGICGLWAVNEDVIYGVGAWFGGPWFIKTTNGGANWSSQTLTGNIQTLVDVYFQDESTGIIVGGDDSSLSGNAVILRTTDKGDTWEEVYHGNSTLETGGEWGWKISFPTPEVGYVSVEYLHAASGVPAKVLKTVDGGQTWTEILIRGSTRSNGLQGIGFLTPEVGWATGRGTTSMTVDGGLSWTQIEGYDPNTNPDGGLDGSTNRITILSPTLAYAVGQHTYKFDGQTPVGIEREQFDSERSFVMEQNYPNPFGTSTTIDYTLYDQVPVRIQIIDMVGRTVKTLVERNHAPGSYSLSWDGRNESGTPVANGMYMYVSDIGDSFEIKRMILIK